MLRDMKERLTLVLYSWRFGQEKLEAVPLAPTSTTKMMSGGNIKQFSCLLRSLQLWDYLLRCTTWCSLGTCSWRLADAWHLRTGLSGQTHSTPVGIHRKHMKTCQSRKRQRKTLSCSNPFNKRNWTFILRALLRKPQVEKINAQEKVLETSLIGLGCMSMGALESNAKPNLDPL